MLPASAPAADTVSPNATVPPVNKITNAKKNAVIRPNPLPLLRLPEALPNAFLL